MPFRGVGLAGRNQPDCLVTIFAAISVGDDHHDSRDRSERLPTFFTFNHTILNAERIRIVENEPRCLQADLVLRKITSVLAFVPFKGHLPVQPISYLQYSTYCESSSAQGALAPIHAGRFEPYLSSKAAYKTRIGLPDSRYAAITRSASTALPS